MTRVLLLGARGFLGTHAASALTAAGALVVPAPPRSRLHLARAGQAQLAALIHRSAPDAVVNAAGVVAGSPQELACGNVAVTRALLAACVAAAPGIRFVQLGSLAEYGTAQAGSRWQEDGPAEPATPYGRAKLDATTAVLAAARNGDVDGCVLRVANPVGAGQPVTSLVGAVLAQLRDHPGATVRVGSLDGRRDIISARDVGRAVAAAVLAAPEQVRERVFNVGTGHPTALRDLVHTVLRESGSSAALVEGTLPGSARSAAVLDAVPAVHRARATLGWVAHDDVATAVRDALAGSGLRRAS